MRIADSSNRFPVQGLQNNPTQVEKTRAGFANVTVQYMYIQYDMLGPYVTKTHALRDVLVHYPVLAEYVTLSRNINVIIQIIPLSSSPTITEMLYVCCAAPFFGVSSLPTVRVPVFLC